MLKLLFTQGLIMQNATLKVHMYTSPIKQVFIRYKIKGKKPINHFISAIDYSSDDELIDAIFTIAFSYEKLYHNVKSIVYDIPEGEHGLFMKSKLENLRNL